MIKTYTRQVDQQREYRVPGLEKGLDVVELLSNASDGLSLKEMADRLERTSQELFRTVSVLASRGYLIRDEAQRYRLSTKLFELGSRQASTQAMIARAMPHMERLAAMIDQSCHLSVVVQNQMLLVAQAECAADVRVSMRVGARFQMHERVSGRVALAFLSVDDRAEYWNCHPELVEKTESIEAELDEIRERGFETAPSSTYIGSWDCAAPIISGGNLLAVLCVCALQRLDEKLDSRQYITAVAECGRTIAAEFGPSPVADQAVSM